ncbi:uncharacterized protein LOC118490423 [Helianthus annuus]|uniref:uncharacterized protein LOC118490423 n=1 Tax=Helianthus annuus TaxID=4232 RepID=UPI0016531546|nr:uncharacterized protein LOC118490423 [Helianthus annuus]
MPVPDENSTIYETNSLINEELSWEMDEVRAEFNKLHNSLNDDQRAVYNQITYSCCCHEDEAPMVHKHAFEALDHTLKDVLSVSDSRNYELPFGGKAIVFGGDFRQILPVVQNGSRQDIVHASLCSSYICSSFKVLNLTTNMCLSVGSSSSNIEEIKEFGKWLLEIGEGNVGDSNDCNSSIERWISKSLCG